MEPIIVEIRLSPATEALLKSFSLPTVTVNTPPRPQSPAELAARMRTQQTPTPTPEVTHPITPAQTAQLTRPGSTPAQAAPGVAPTAPTSQTLAYFTAPVAPPPPAYPVNPQQYRPPMASAPVANPTPAPAANPSNPAPVAAAPGYSIDDLARAAAQLMDAGKQQQLIALLGQFQVQSLGQLPKEQFGAFATALRQMGARI